MSIDVKICGLSTPEGVTAAQAGGATHLGFIFFPKSPRNVSPDRAAGLAAGVGTAKTVAVTVDADNDFIEEIVATMQPAMLQLHGTESTERVKSLRNRFGLPVIKALAIRDHSDLSKVAAHDGVADVLLLDAKPPAGSDLPGGNGVRFDWELLEGLKTKTPILLSGGVNLGNAAEAISFVNRDDNSILGLDVSSGVESAPGVKDTAKIKTLLATCFR